MNSKNDDKASNRSEPLLNTPKRLKSILKNKATRERRRGMRSPSPTPPKVRRQILPSSVTGNSSTTGSNNGLGRCIHLLGLTPKEDKGESENSLTKSPSISPPSTEANNGEDSSSSPSHPPTIIISPETISANVTVKSDTGDTKQPEMYDIYDDDVICLDTTCNEVDVPTLQCDIDNIVHNMVDEGVRFEFITPKLVARRLNNLYQRDFLNRTPGPDEDDSLKPQNFLKTVEMFLSAAKRGVNQEKAQVAIESSVMIAPGVRQYDLNTLDHGEWLNDVIINYYISMLVRDRTPGWTAISSFFLEEIQRSQALGHKKPTTSLPVQWIGTAKHLLIPMCVESHWSLLYCNVDNKRFEVYNSLEPSENDRKSVMLVAQFIKREQENAQKCKSKWVIAYKDEMHIQKNHSDCGVYTCMFARMLIFMLGANLKLEYVGEFRRWMKREIEGNQLLS